MSEAEKRRRLFYKENRKKWLRLGSLILAGAVLVTAILAAVFFGMDKDTFIAYTEEGNVDYSVILKNNDIFGSDYDLSEDDMYVASLIDKVNMEFRYKLLMAQAAKYTYSYSADAQIVIKDSTTKKVIYKGRLNSETDEILPKETVTLSEPKQRLSFGKLLVVDYAAYNARAKEIISALELKGVTCALEVKMSIDVKGSVENVDSEKDDTYHFSLEMPLNTDKVSFSKTSSIPTGENKIIVTNEGAARMVFLVLTIIFLVLTALFALVFVAFIFLTRNTDINYNIKVNKVVSNYKSYIQKIINPFDRTGYQLLMMSDFTDLLEIRDTIQSPILMNENEDKTCTTFMIPTNTKLLYIFEIKVADYDEIYKTVDEGEETPITTDELPEIIDENAENGLVLLENDVDEEMLATATAMPSVPLSQINYDEDEDRDDVEEGVEVIGVVWPGKKKHNKVYRYDPNGEYVTKGDVVLVPSRDVGSNRDIIRKATVAHGNHKVDPENLAGPLKKIIGVFRRRAEELLMPKDDMEFTFVPASGNSPAEELPLAEPTPEVMGEAEAVPYENEESAVAEAIAEAPAEGETLDAEEALRIIAEAANEAEAEASGSGAAVIEETLGIIAEAEEPAEEPVAN